MKRVIFTNKCKVPNWVPDDEKIFRENADVYFTKALSQVGLFDDCEIEVTYFSAGVGSIVAKLVSIKGVYVIKTTSSINRTVSEINGFKIMSKNRIKVPEIYHEGVCDEYPFFIMEYFDTGTLQDRLDNGGMDISEVGNIKAEVFNNLHNISGDGYGWLIGYEDGVASGEFSTFQAFIKSWFCKEKLIDVAMKAFPEIDWKNRITTCYDFLISKEEYSRACFGSFDLQSAHFFATDPPTLFDPDVRLESMYLNLAFLLLPALDISSDENESRKRITFEFQQRHKDIDFEYLKEAIWLQTFRKATSLLLNTDESRTRRGLYMLQIISNEEKFDKYIEQYLINE